MLSSSATLSLCLKGLDVSKSRALDVSSRLRDALVDIQPNQQNFPAVSVVGAKDSTSSNLSASDLFLAVFFHFFIRLSSCWSAELRLLPTLPSSSIVFFAAPKVTSACLSLALLHSLRLPSMTSGREERPMNMNRLCQHRFDQRLEVAAEKKSNMLGYIPKEASGPKPMMLIRPTGDIISTLRCLKDYY